MFRLTTRNRYDQQSVGGNQTTPPGYYMAKILQVDPMRSRSGNDMLQLTIEVDAGGLRCLEVKDYLILNTASAWKIEQYLAAIGKQFDAGQEITIDQRTFLGGKFVALTCNEPGVKNPDRLYVKIFAAMRPQDARHMGALEPDELKYYGLSPDGTPARVEQRAVALQQQPQNDMWRNDNSMGMQQQGNAWGQAPQPQPHPGHQQPQNGWQQGNAQPAPVDNMADDDIPF